MTFLGRHVLGKYLTIIGRGCAKGSLFVSGEQINYVPKPKAYANNFLLRGIYRG